MTTIKLNKLEKILFYPMAIFATFLGLWFLSKGSILFAIAYLAVSAVIWAGPFAPKINSMILRGCIWLSTASAVGGIIYLVVNGISIKSGNSGGY